MVRELPRLLHEDPATAIRTIAWSGMARPEFPEPIITPFVIPTVLAALWSVLRHPDSWGQAVAGVIRMGGDVDTLGAIVGALMGAKVGVQNIPPNLLESVLNRDALQTLALRYHALVSGK
jgi:ADP-ribosylglycohydrolase